MYLIEFTMQHKDHLPVKPFAIQVEDFIVESKNGKDNSTGHNLTDELKGDEECRKRQDGGQSEGEEHSGPGQLVGHFDRNFLADGIGNAIAVGHDRTLFGIARSAKHFGMTISTRRLLYELHSNLTSVNLGYYPIVGNMVVHCYLFGFSI